MVVGKTAPSITPVLSAETVTVGGTVHDSATLHGTTPNAGGTVTYTVYTDDACTTGAMGGSTKTVTNGIVPDSTPVTFNSAGDYYWQAFYSGDANNGEATSVCTEEHVVVGKTAPSITTVLSAETVTVGGSVHDSATLHGTTPNAGGTVTYTVYTDSACTTGAMAASTETVTNGIVPDSSAVIFTEAGTYYWQAHYTGDANNGEATSPCTDEILAVYKATPEVATVIYDANGNPVTSVVVGSTVHDQATVTGLPAFAPTGSVNFTFYTNGDCSGAGSTAGSATVGLNGAAGPSANEGPLAAGSYSFTAHYNGDDHYMAADGPCEPLTVSPSTATIAPTSTTCQQFASGTAPTLSSLQYTVKGKAINSVAPGVFFYYTTVTAPGTGTFTITVDQTEPGGFQPFATQKSQAILYSASCQKLATTRSDGNGDVTLTANATAAGQVFIVGIKYDATSIKGTHVDSPYPTVTYTFVTEVNGTEIPTSSQSLTVQPK